MADRGPAVLAFLLAGVLAHRKLRREGENGEEAEGDSGGAHWHRRGPVLAGIWAETRWPAAARWAAVSGDVGSTKTGKTGSSRRGEHHGGVRLARRRTSVANWSCHGRRWRCQLMFRRRRRCAVLLSIQFGWNGIPGTFRRPIRAVPDPRSGSEFPGTGIAATIRVPCDCDCTLLRWRRRREQRTNERESKSVLCSSSEHANDDDASQPLQVLTETLPGWYVGMATTGDAVHGPTC